MRALLELALNEKKGPISLKNIAQNQEISLQYLEHLIKPLIAGGIIKSIRGARGGISLAKPAQDIKLSDILLLLEGSNSPVECVDRPDSCHRASFCPTRDVWSELKDAINNVLENMSLQDLVERQKLKKHDEEIMYYI